MDSIKPSNKLSPKVKVGSIGIHALRTEISITSSILTTISLVLCFINYHSSSFPLTYF